MVQNQFSFKLISPERELLSEPAWQVTIPGVAGDVGVRSGHMALLISIRPGVVEIIREQGSAPERIFIAGGFADIAQDHCTILAEDAYEVAKIDREKLEQELARLNDDLGLAENLSQKSSIHARIKIVQAMLKTVSQ